MSIAQLGPMVVNRKLMQRLGKYKPSVIALIAANVVPLVGVLFWGWSVFAIMAIYWAENVIIGAINVLKMITCSPDPDEVKLAQAGDPAQTAAVQAAIDKLAEQGSQLNVMHHASKLFFVPFFIVHYGMFCAVHGVFVLVLFGNDGKFGGGLDGGVAQLSSQIFQGGLAFAVLALAASHLFSFFKNYLADGEYRRTIVPALMFQPYARIVVMHLAILFGGFATMFLGSPVFALLILIAGKTGIDLKFHLRQHRRNTASGSDELGQVETV